MLSRGFVNCRVSGYFFFFSSRRRHTRCSRDWSSDVCSSDLNHFARVKEVPYSFRRRKRGKSKLTSKVIAQYLGQLWRLSGEGRLPLERLLRSSRAIVLRPKF